MVEQWNSVKTIVKFYGTVEQRHRVTYSVAEQWNSGTVAQCLRDKNEWWNSGTVAQCHRDI